MTDVTTVLGPDLPLPSSAGERASVLLRYAALAPSMRHTPTWRFNVEGDSIEVVADTAHWPRIGDRDQRELDISVGCAIENLIVAADHFGYRCDVAYPPTAGRPALIARVTIEPAPAGARRARPSGLFSAMLERRPCHGRFTAEAIRPVHRRRLHQVPLEPGVQLWLTDAIETRDAFDAATRDATALAYRDPGVRRELGDLVGAGIFGTAPLVSAFARLALPDVDATPRIARRESQRPASARLFGVVATASDGRLARVRSGQVFARLFLRAAALGLTLQPMSQALEMPALRERITALIPGQSLFVQQAFRVGRSTARVTRQTPRRPRDTVVVATGGRGHRHDRHGHFRPAVRGVTREGRSTRAH